MNRSYIERIKNAIPLSSVVSRRVNLKKWGGGGRFKGLCPFHNEKTPSFSVNDERGFYKCFGCDAKGDLIDFVMVTEGLPYPEALEKLAREAGVELPKETIKSKEEQDQQGLYYQIYESTTKFYHAQLMTSSEGRNALIYLKKRGLSDTLIEKARLGYAPQNSQETYKHLSEFYKAKDIIDSCVLGKMEEDKPGSRIYNQFRGRVIFPIIDKKNQVIAFGGRALSDEIQPKYLNSSESPIFSKKFNLYGLNLASTHAHRSKQIILVEGYMDVLGLIQAGISNVVAPLGTAVSIDQIKMLWYYSPTPVICLDQDQAGKRAMLSIAQMVIPYLLPEKSLNFCLLQGGKDPDEVVKKHGIEYFLNLIKSSLTIGDYIFERVATEAELKTPEQKAKLEKALDAIANSIEDKQLAKQYWLFFREKLRTLLHSLSKKRASLPGRYLVARQAELHIRNFMQQEASHYKTILALLFAYPKLLENHDIYEAIVNIKIPLQSLDKLRDLLLNITDEAFENGDLDNSIEIPEELKTTVREVQQTYSIKSADHALGLVQKALLFAEIDAVAAQMQEVEAERAQNPQDSAALIRLESLQEIHYNLRKKLENR
jgi:DNA primase